LQKVFIPVSRYVKIILVSDARQQLHGIFMQFGKKNIETAWHLRDAVCSNF